jgi:hypothetical protein
MLLEGLAHLTTMKDDWATRVQMCIAQVSKLQLDDSVHTPQIDVLVLMLDLACSLHQKAHQLSAQKLTALQKRLEELKQSPDWPNQFGEMLLPINRMPNAQGTVSADTRAVVRPGEGVDYLVISTLGKQQAWALGYGYLLLRRSHWIGTDTVQVCFAWNCRPLQSHHPRPQFPLVG